MIYQMNKLVTRRRALLSLATVTAGTFIKTTNAIAVQPVKTRLRFPVVGDCGTGDSDQIRIAQKMYEAHHQAPLDFVIAAGDNIYPNGSGHYFAKHFEEPFAALLKERVSF